MVWLLDKMKDKMSGGSRVVATERTATQPHTRSHAWRKQRPRVHAFRKIYDAEHENARIDHAYLIILQDMVLHWCIHTTCSG
jgi:hypothetical protein